MGRKKPKKKKKALYNWIFIGVVVIGAAAVAWYSYTNIQKETRWKLQEYQSVESTYRGDLELSVLASATLHPFEIIQVRPEASGKIEELYVDVGDWVDEGDPIARLDQADLQTRLDTANAELSRSNANLALVRRGYTPRELQSYESAVDRAQLALDEATEDLERVQQLHESGFASDEELDSAEYAHDQAQQNLEQAQDALEVLTEGSTIEEIRSAEAAVAIARANLQDAQNALGDATIYAPMSGVILEKYVTEGSVVVSSLASFSGGDSLCVIGDLSTMKALSSVDENDIGHVMLGQKVILDVDAYPDEEFEGTVYKIHPQASLEGGVTVFTVEVEVPNPDSRLMAGMSCEVEIITETFTDILLVPDRAIVQRDDSDYVFVVDENDNIEARKIEVGETNFEDTEVLSGLEEGESVIVRGVPSDLLDEVAGESDDESGGGGVRVEVD
jgi:HlyD family secretion protein